ncbi:uncharacterized protein [Eurosta solidaginis]|uniref:uncharacterized protein isoform X1 n=2 Tax=Eurosta solidaginis TaxID=178769 RepID=UPI0035316CCF
MGRQTFGNFKIQTMSKRKKFSCAPLRESSNNTNINTVSETETSTIAVLKNDIRILKENVAECKTMFQKLINTQAKSNIMLTEISTQKHIRTTFPIKSLDELERSMTILVKIRTDMWLS